MIKFEKAHLVLAALIYLISCSSSTLDSSVGKWNIELSSPIGISSQIWSIASNGTGYFESDLGNSASDEVIIDGNALRFTIFIDAGGQSVAMNFDGIVKGDFLTGQISSEFGEFEVIGTRQSD